VRGREASPPHASRLTPHGGPAPIGLLGGTFDPVHHGHLRTALELYQSLGLAQVRLIPCRIPPHRGQPHAAAEARLAMVAAACAGTPGLAVDDRELKRAGPSYMVETLESLRAELPETPLALIVGTDAFLGLPTWHRWAELPTLAHLLVVHRPGWHPPESGVMAELLAERRLPGPAGLRRAVAGGILPCEVTRLEISATAIREQLAAGLNPRYLLPDSVLAYIETHGCYAREAAVLT